MRFIFLIGIILFSSFSLKAQSWKEVNDSLLYYYNNNDFNNAAIVGEKALTIAQKEFGELHADFATSLNNLASVYKKLSQYEKAELLFKKAVNIRKSVLGEDHPEYANSLSDLGSLYRKIKDYKKAEPCFLQLADYFAKKGGTQSLDYALQLNYLGIIYAAMDSAKKAESFYQTSIAIIRNNNTDENLFESVLYNLSNLYFQQNKYELAEPLFIELVSLQQKLYGANNEDYITCIENLAFTYRKNINANKNPMHVFTSCRRLG